MNIYGCVDINIYIEKAKDIVMKAYGRDSTRRWLDVSANSYTLLNEGIRCLVWEGTPAKGYVIINYGRGSIRAFGVDDKLLKTYKILNYIRK